MGRAREPEPGKLFIGIILGVPELLPQVRQSLARRFGPIDLESEPHAFVETPYYRPEMGEELERLFLSHESLIDPGRLPLIKHETNRMEEGFSRDGARRVNLDPGVLFLDKVVLATTKNYSHRPYLGFGIYAELTYLFRRGRWEPLPWTYPDYRAPHHGAFFEELRRLYKTQRQAGLTGR